MTLENNIQYISENALCTACGGCCGICPTEAIAMATNTSGFLLAKVDFSKCIDCGNCIDVCPSITKNTPEINQHDIFHGQYISGYIGHAVNPIIRKKSQSGGIVTALLCYLVENELIDGAIINLFNKQTSRPKAFCVDKIEDVINGAGSFYSQSSVVETIMENQDQRTAAVMLGCQSESLQLIKNKFPNFVFPEYNIGLICSGQYSGKKIDDLIRRSKCKQLLINKVRFKDKDAGGWPGNVKIYSEKGEFVLDKSVRHMLKPVYECYRCLLCFDQMNIFSDITVGDPWGIQNKSNSDGNTVIITRTQKGENLIKDAVKAKSILIESLSVDAIIKGQTVDDRLKTQFFTGLSLVKEFDGLVPYNTQSFENIDFVQPSKKKFREIKNRYLFSKKFYVEVNESIVEKMIKRKTKKAKRRKMKRKIVRFLRGFYQFLFHSSKLSNSQNEN